MKTLSRFIWFFMAMVSWSISLEAYVRAQEIYDNRDMVIFVLFLMATSYWLSAAIDGLLGYEKKSRLPD